jgi:hypothetical protein
MTGALVGRHLIITPTTRRLRSVTSRAIALGPGRAVPFFNRAGALASSRHVDRAPADHNRAIERDPMDPDARGGRTLEEEELHRRQRVHAS